MINPSSDSAELFEEDVHETYDFTGPVLGSGAFATVLRVRDRMSGVEYAIKQVNLAGIMNDESTMRMLYNEIQGMKILSHPNIVRLQEVYQPKGEEMLYLVLDRLEGGSVEALLKQSGRVEEGHAGYIMAQVVDAVRYCHDLNIAHRDLKLANCMFEDSSEAPIVKVIDFGLCTELKDGQTSSAFVGTMTYAAPEVIMKNKGHGIECDMWSVGVMTYVLVAGRLPFYADDGAALEHQIKFVPHAFPDEVWKDVSALCRDFVDKCLNKNPKKRMTAKQAQEHPWMKKAAKAMEGAPLSKGAVLAMMKFQETNMFEKIAMELVAYSYEPSQIKDLERHFREMDTDGTGLVSLEEFKAAIMERRRAIVQRKQEEARPTEAAEDPPGATNGKSPGEERREKAEGSAGGIPGRTGTGDAAEEVKGDTWVAAVPVMVTADVEAASSETDKRDSEKTRKELGAGTKRPSVTMSEVGRIVRKMSAREGLFGRSGSNSADNEESSTSVPSRSRRDMNGAGTSARSLEVAAMFGRLDEEGVERIFEAIDVDGTGMIDITEFVAACLVKRQINDTAIKAAFHRLDYSMTGLISAEDMSMYLGNTFDETKMEEYMREISSRDDGLVTLEDFTLCLKEHVLKSSLSSRGSSRRTTVDSSASRRSTVESSRPTTEIERQEARATNHDNDDGDHPQ